MKKNVLTFLLWIKNWNTFKFRRWVKEIKKT